MRKKMIKENRPRRRAFGKDGGFILFFNTIMRNITIFSALVIKRI